MELRALRSGRSGARPISRSLRGVATVPLLVALILLSSPNAVPPSRAGSAKGDPALVAAAARSGSTALPIVVREARPSSAAAERLVRSVGGSVTRELGIIGGFAGRVPADELPALLDSSAVSRVWGDGTLHMTAVDSQFWDRVAPNSDWRGSAGLDSIPRVDLARPRPTVALLDTGVSRVLDLGTRVLARVDMTPEHDGYDHFGHGTHMAGIIAGNGIESFGRYMGANPWANLVSVKVAGANGATDVSVVLAALQWIMQNRTRYDIRVLNLSFGTDSTQPYRLDPLDYAVERVWRSGILVVVAAGNRGPSAVTINKPADDPYVLTVGAVNTKHTADRSDDVMARFSARGPTQDGFSKPDLVAPGVTIVSDRATGSSVDASNPGARVGRAYFKGTGTSQAAAVVSGVASLLFQDDPKLTPDQAKGILVSSAYRLANQAGSGSGEVNAAAALQLARGGSLRRVTANTGLTPSTGSGSLEASRGSLHVYADLGRDGVNANDADGHLDLVTGEIDVLGTPWSLASWAQQGWSGSPWAPLTAVQDGWTTTAWQGASWSGTAWQATGWSATGWAATGWSATGWATAGWGDDLWS